MKTPTTPKTRKGFRDPRLAAIAFWSAWRWPEDVDTETEDGSEDGTETPNINKVEVRHE